MYICVYIYIHQCMAVGRIWGSFSCPSKEGSGRRTHEGLPMHPLGGRELYIVSRGWSLDWLLGVCLPPRYFPRFFSIAFFFFLLFPLSTPYFESRRFFDTFIPSSFLSIVKLLGNSFERERRKEKRALIFVRFPRFRKGIFLHFPFAFTQPPRLGYFLLLPLSSSLPFFLAWRPLEPRRVAADSWSGLLIYAYLSYPTTLLHPPTCICK